jgi:hypothetical protein
MVQVEDISDILTPYARRDSGLTFERFGLTTMQKHNHTLESSVNETSGAGAGGVGGSIEVGAQKLAPIGMKAKSLEKKSNPYIEKNKREGAPKLLSFKEWKNVVVSS